MEFESTWADGRERGVEVAATLDVMVLVAGTRAVGCYVRRRYKTRLHYHAKCHRRWLLSTEHCWRVSLPCQAKA